MQSVQLHLFASCQETPAPPFFFELTRADDDVFVHVTVGRLWSDWMKSKGLSELLSLVAHLGNEQNLPFLNENPLSVPEVTQPLSFHPLLPYSCHSCLPY